MLDQKVKFAEDCLGRQAEKMANSLQTGQVLLLENLRFHPEERENDQKRIKIPIPNVCKEFQVQYCDLYKMLRDLNFRL